MQKITPFLWFNNNAMEAAEFYCGIFQDAKILNIMGNGPSGGPMGATLKLAGQEFIAFNGGPHFSFTPAISLFVSCETQAEIDEKWDKLSAGGQIQQCGWLTDKFGLSWQIVPPILGQLLGDKDPQKAKRVMDAMLKMKKLDIKILQQAAEG